MQQPWTKGLRRPSALPKRIEGWDIYRGFAILAVLFIHVLGNFLPKVPTGSWEWYALAIPNRALQFAVPSFLMLTAYLNAGNLLRGYSLGRYVWSRTRRVLWPYILWSDLYILFRFRDHREDLQVDAVTQMLIWGKAYYHLYFLVLALQLYVLLPFVVSLFRRRPAFWMVAVGAVVLELIVYAVNRYVYPARYVGSIILWYVPSVAFGLWLVSQSDRLAEIQRKGLPAAVLMAVLGFALYCPLAVDVLLGRPVDTFVYQIGFWVYTTAMSFLLAIAAWRLQHNENTTFLRTCGMHSLPIYLIHPLVLWAIDRYFISYGFFGIVSELITYYGVCLLLPLLFARVAASVRASRWLFGSEDPAPGRLL